MILPGSSPSGSIKNDDKLQEATPKPSTAAATEAKAEMKEHVIQIENDPESPSKNLYITKEEDSNLQKPITPTPSLHSKTDKPEQILSAATLEKDHSASRSDSKKEQKPNDSEKDSDENEEEKPKQEKPKESKPKPPKPKPAPESELAPAPKLVTDKGKSKITGKIVSGWL